MPGGSTGRHPVLLGNSVTEQATHCLKGSSHNHLGTITYPTWSLKLLFLLFSLHFKDRGTDTQRNLPPVGSVHKFPQQADWSQKLRTPSSSFKETPVCEPSLAASHNVHQQKTGWATEQSDQYPEMWHRIYYQYFNCCTKHSSFHLLLCVIFLLLLKERDECICCNLLVTIYFFK